MKLKPHMEGMGFSMHTDHFACAVPNQATIEAAISALCAHDKVCTSTAPCSLGWMVLTCCTLLRVDGELWLEVAACVPGNFTCSRTLHFLQTEFPDCGWKVESVHGKLDGEVVEVVGCEIHYDSLLAAHTALLSQP